MSRTSKTASPGAPICRAPPQPGVRLGWAPFPAGGIVRAPRAVWMRTRRRSLAVAVTGRVASSGGLIVRIRAYGDASSILAPTFTIRMNASSTNAAPQARVERRAFGGRSDVGEDVDGDVRDACPKMLSGSVLGLKIVSRIRSAARSRRRPVAIDRIAPVTMPPIARGQDDADAPHASGSTPSASAASRRLGGHEQQHLLGRACDQRQHHDRERDRRREAALRASPTTSSPKTNRPMMIVGSPVEQVEGQPDRARGAQRRRELGQVERGQDSHGHCDHASPTATITAVPMIPVRSRHRDAGRAADPSSGSSGSARSRRARRPSRCERPSTATASSAAVVCARFGRAG